jgi:glycosyltransferase involved in cell wall biosynthesis
MPDIRPTGIAVVASHPPRRCGIATFSLDLIAALRLANPAVTVQVAAIDTPSARHSYGNDVRWCIRQGDGESFRDVAEAINASDVDLVNVQHEFALYGTWTDNVYEDHLRPLLETLQKPVVTTLHSVPPQPAESIRDAVRSAALLSDALVVMARTAEDLLRTVYGITEGATIIPHGMPAIDPMGRRRIKEKLGLSSRTLISTFGLVDPRKGLEYMIQALPAILEGHPDVLYVIAGQTHPELIRQFGERYRDQLTTLVERLGLQAQVCFLNEYMTQQDIVDLLVSTDVYVTPYLDPQQITSGTLAYALGAGRAIVSTPYLHALEALDEGRGVVVGFRNPEQLAQAVNSILDDPQRKKSLERRAYAYAKDMAWPRAGERWLATMNDVLARAAAPPLMAGG